MIRLVGTFQSSYKKKPVYYYIYKPDGPIRAIVQLSHGMCEHVGRYEEFARFLTERGILFCGHDHLGHGNTGQTNGEMGFFAEKGGYRYLVKDLYFCTRIIQAKYPNIPYFLMGHSMGSFIARAYLSKYAAHLTGCILSGTSGRNQLSSVAVAVADVIAKAKGEHFRSKYLYQLALGAYNNGFEGKTNCEWLTRDKAIQEAYLLDEWCQFKFTAAAYRDVFTLVNMINRVEWYHSFPSKLPLYIMSGAQDPVGLKGVTIKQLYYELLMRGHRNVTMRLYEGARHELLNETNREEVSESLYEWITTCIL